ATGTLRDDIPGGAFDEFTVKWAVGSQSFAVSPELFELGNATPTFLLPTYNSTITNTGELPLSRLKSFSSEFINIDQSGSVATDNINLTSPAFIDILNSEPSQAYVYVPGGKATGTYTATFTWYEDANKNNVKDAQEGTDYSIASFVVKPFYRLYPWKITADFGGVKPNTTKTISIGIINAGSLSVSRLRFINSDLSDGTNTFAEGHLTLPTDVLDITPGELRYFDVSATVPPAHINSVFVGSMTVYGDLNDNSSLDSADEPWCDMKLRIEIGDQKLNITSPVEVILSGYAASSTNSVSVAAKNTGSMALSRVRMQSTDLAPGAGLPVASSTVLFSPSSLLGSLVINQTRSPAVLTAVPFGQPPGLYEGTIWAWEDANNDSIRQIEETAASVPVKLTISTLKALNVSPASIFLGIFARGDTATASIIAQNIGNTNLDDARWHKAPLGPIASAGITITPDPVNNPGDPAGYVNTPAIGFPENVVSTLTLNIPTSGVPDGLHSGVQKFYEDEYDPALNIYDPGLEPFANLTLSIRIATPFISVNPDPIVIPAADPVGQTASGNFIIQNSSILNYKNLRYRVGNLTSGANTIASSAITTLPGTFTALLAGQSEAAEISARVFPPHSYPPGVYTGAFTIYDDRNFNGVRDLHEQETTAVISLTIKTYPGLDILQTNLNAGKIARNTFSTALPIGFRNTGNVPLNGLFWSASDLFKEPGILVPVASLTFAFSQPEP
ncbi:MAG TPA: hypothetical protein PLM07_21385, partial [Candidatus Rifleibacterium sp.]|nr:hypothetical protein [Candidatus Rifleibacterium sp.]